MASQGVDLEGNSTFANRAMSEITGWELHELIGRNQHQMLHHSHKDGSPHLSGVPGIPDLSRQHTALHR